MQLNLGDLVQMRKTHPCGSDRWVITRTGADIKIKCEGCGRLIHLDCGELQEIRNHLQVHHGFLWNTGRTVFYGTCADCAGSRESAHSEEDC